MEAENLDVFQNLNFDAMSEQEIYMAILMLQARHNMTSASITHWIQFINPQTTKRWQKVPTLLFFQHNSLKLNFKILKKILCV